MGFSSSLAGQNKVGPNLRSTSPDGDSTLMTRAPCVARIRPHEFQAEGVQDHSLLKDQE